MRTLGAKNKVHKPVKLSTYILFRVTEEQQVKAKEMAQNAGKSLSDYARDKFFQDGDFERSFASIPN